MSVVLIAHRGGTDKYPELTLAAAKHSLELGADYVELDIRFTKDKVPVITHDEDAVHLFGKSVCIREMTVEQFVALTYLSDPNYHPHTLEEILSSGVAPILFHVKEGGESLAQLLKSIRIHGYEDKVVMGVSTIQGVHSVKAFNKDIKVLAFIPNKERIKEFIAYDVNIIRLWEEWVDEESVDQIHAAGRQVWVMAGSPAKGTTGYTTVENILTWKQLGVNGILIDKINGKQALL